MWNENDLNRRFVGRRSLVGNSEAAEALAGAALDDADRLAGVAEIGRPDRAGDQDAIYAFVNGDTVWIKDRRLDRSCIAVVDRITHDNDARSHAA